MILECAHGQASTLRGVFDSNVVFFDSRVSLRGEHAGCQLWPSADLKRAQRRTRAR